MKKSIVVLISFFFVFSTSVFSQVAGSPVYGFYLSNNKDSFNIIISPEFNKYLNQFYKSENIDSSNCDFLPSSHVATTFLKGNLDSVSYKFITITKQNGFVKKEVHDNFYPNKISRKKIMVYYGKNEKEKTEIMTIDYIY